MITLYDQKRTGARAIGAKTDDYTRQNSLQCAPQPDPNEDATSRRTLARGTYLHAAGDVTLFPRRLDIDVHPTDPPPLRRRTLRRGRVTLFSRKSRYNMFRTLAAVELHRHSLPWFATLTYHKRFPAGRPQLLADMAAFVERLRRRFPHLAYVKKLEPQKRTYPHWHLILWSDAFDVEFEHPDTARWIADQWHQIAEPESADHAQHGARVEPIDTYRKLIAYLSKYCAKVDEGDEWPYPGRRWSTGYHLKCRPLERVGATQHQLAKLKRAARLLMRLRNTSKRHLGHLRRYQSSVTLFLHEGEPERLLAIAGINALGERPAAPPGWP